MQPRDAEPVLAGVTLNSERFAKKELNVLSACGGAAFGYTNDYGKDRPSDVTWSYGSRVFCSFFYLKCHKSERGTLSKVPQIASVSNVERV